MNRTVLFRCNSSVRSQRKRKPIPGLPLFCMLSDRFSEQRDLARLRKVPENACFLQILYMCL